MGMKQEFSEDTVIINENAESRLMYMILEGTVALYSDYGKNTEYLIGLCGKGKVIGELGLLCHEASIYTAVAITDVTAMSFSEFELQSFMKNYPDQAIGIMRNIAHINKVLNRNLKMLMEDSSHMELMIEAYQQLNNETETKDNKESAKWRYIRNR